MKLITKELERKFETVPLGATECARSEEIPVLVKYFSCLGRYTFYVTEAEKQENGDWLFFGYCKSPLGEMFDEFGYVTLSQLSAIPTMERDLYYGNHSLQEAMNDGI